MINLKIVRKNGMKNFSGKTYQDYTVLDERGYTFSILSSVIVPDWLEYLPVMICSYKGQPKVRVDVGYLQDTIKAHATIE